MCMASRVSSFLVLQTLRKCVRTCIVFCILQPWRTRAVPRSVTKKKHKSGYRCSVSQQSLELEIKLIKANLYYALHILNARYSG